MTPKKATPLVLMIFTVMCALPAAVGLVPAAIAQEETTSLEDLASGIVSDVLDGSGNNDDVNSNDEDDEENDDGAAAGEDDGDGDSNTQISVPITDQDQRDANLAEQLGLNADIVEQEVQEEVTPTPSEEEDTTPPTLTVPDDILAEPTSAEGAVVTFTVTAEDNVDGTATLDGRNVLTQDDDVGGDITISCDPPSGSVFPIGSTTVECTATDEAGNTATALFTITVAFTCQGEIATIVGTPGNDDLSGTGARDVIALLEGDDRVNAGGGDDLICGDEGNDPVLVGDAGNDEVFGGEGNDVMFGGSDNDLMDGGAGNDRMSGGAGNDNLNSVDGVVNNDSLNGDTGTDTCTSDPDPEINCEL